MIEWVGLLQAALTAEFHTGPMIASLATVDGHHRPRARSMVIRRIEADGSLWFCTDGRSDKAGEVRESPFAEVVFWLPSLREQFRVAGSVGRATDLERTELWGELSDAARALFAWPAPGRPRADEPFPKGLPREAPIPDNFEAMLVRPDRVDHLDLTGHPHRRTRWEGPPSWEAREINP